MTWTPDAQKAVARALLGNWPGIVSAWGREALAAYIEALEGRGLTAESVLLAIRAWGAGDFAPSAPSLSAAARRAAFREFWLTGRCEALPAGERERYGRILGRVENLQIGAGE